MQLIFLLPPVLIVSILTITRWLLDDIEKVEVALDLHVTGISFLIPLPLLREEMVAQLTVAVLASCLLLCITDICYVVVKRGLHQNIMLCERLALLLGGLNFLLGFVASVILS